MPRSRFRLVAAALLLAALSSAFAEPTATKIKFSDPAKPGTIKISLARGDLQVRGADATEVTVSSEAAPPPQTVRKDGLRVLTASSSFSLTEKNNVITLDALAEGWTGTPSDFTVVVPRNTSIVVSNSLGGDITCAGLSGDIEIKSMNGEVRLDDLAGAALVETMNGEIKANVRELHDNKPISFTSMNGEVVVRLPAATKANVRLRTQNGSILTDFDDKALVTKVEAMPNFGRRITRSSSHNVLTPEVRDAIREATRVGADAVREAMDVAREAAAAAREAAEEQREADGDHVAAPKPPTPPRPPKTPMPPMPSIPTITGGKLVTGTLNGGGPEINIATMNGDVTLRQLEKK